MEIKTREDFLKLDIKERVEYINTFTSKGMDIKDIAERFNLNAKTLSKSLSRAGYIYSREDKIYIFREQETEKNTPETPEKHTTTQTQHKDTTKKTKNTNTTPVQHEHKHDTNTTPVQKEQTTDELLEGVKELLAIKDQLKALVGAGTAEKRLEIDQNLFKGDLNSRNFKLYANVRERLDSFTKKNKLYKTQDIVNYALMYFLDEFDK